MTRQTPRPQIGTAGLPWLSQHARLFEECVRRHGTGEPDALVRSRSKHDRRRIAELAGVTEAYVWKLSWYEMNPTTGRVGTRETTKVRAVLGALGWELEEWLAVADGRMMP